jgi:hypothetical protein
LPITAQNVVAFVTRNNDDKQVSIRTLNDVTPADPNAPILAFTSPATITGKEGVALTHTFTTQEANLTGTTTFAVTTGTLPAGLTLSGATISGTPTAVGQTQVTITATNGSVTATQNLTITITPDVPVGENLLANGSFENWTDALPESWTAFTPANVTITKIETGAQDGNIALKMASAGGTGGVQQEIQGIVPGVTYTISFWYKDNTKGGSAQGMRLWSNFLNGTANIAPVSGDGLQPGSTLDAVTSWTEYTIEVVAPANATGFRFQVRATQGHEAIIDNLSISVKP